MRLVQQTLIGLALTAQFPGCSQTPSPHSAACQKAWSAQSLPRA
jgi:hypothetical protein